MAVLLLVPALASLAVVPLLFAAWFDAGDTFAALHGEKAGILLEPTAWDGSSSMALLLVLLVIVVVGSAALAGRGTFAAWAVGAAAAILGALVCLMLRQNPPDPGHGTFVTGAQAYDPTSLPLVAMACFLLAAVDLTGWAMIARRRA